MSSIQKHKLNLKGGNPYKKLPTYNKKTGKYKINLNDNTYYYRVERYSPDGDKLFRIIDFITLEDEYKTIDCGLIQIDKKTNTANIASLGSDPNCVISKNNNKFKYGDILFQIMIEICKRENINKIYLTDSSNIKCNNHKLNLNFLKTITQGIPHYYKYGFRPTSEIGKNIVESNLKLFLTNPKIDKRQLLKIIMKFSNQTTIKKFIKVLGKIDKEEISIRNFMMLITQDLNNAYYCDLAYGVHEILFLKAGYVSPSSEYELLLS